MDIPWIQSINYLINQWCCFIEKAAFIISEPVSRRSERCWMMEHHKPSLSLLITSSHHCNWARVSPPGSPPSTSPSLPHSFGCCDSPAAMGASILVQILILGDFTFNPQSLIRCVSHRPWLWPWSAAGSWVSADLGQEWDYASNRRSSASANFLASRD